MRTFCVKKLVYFLKYILSSRILARASQTFLNFFGATPFRQRAISPNSISNFNWGGMSIGLESTLWARSLDCWQLRQRLGWDLGCAIQVILSGWGNVKLMKCHLGNVKLMKCYVGEMSNCWNVMLMKCQVDEMSCWWNVKLMKCHVDEMSSWWNAKLMKC